jgi:HK97 family phage portal protein
MWPFSIFKKSATVDIRDIDLSDSALSFLGLTDGELTQIPPRKAYQLSERNSDLGDAVGRISESVAELTKGIKNQNKKIDYTHPFIELMENPGGGVSGSQFWRELTESYLLTSEAWVVLRGNVNRPPLEMKYIRPYNVSIILSENDGLPVMISTQSTKDRRDYFRQRIKGRIRYIDKLNMNEIIPIIGAVSTVDEWRGRSKLSKLYYDLEMNTDGKRHNVSLLKNGMRVTALIMPDAAAMDSIDKKHWDNKTTEGIAKALRVFNQGAGNAGNISVLSRPAKVEGLSQNNKDMDFISLLSKSQISIYNLFKIPLAKILPDAMTLDNYNAANRVYYTEAVFPVFDEIGEGLLSGIRDRYNLPPQTTLTFSEVEVRNLRPVLVENMEKLKMTEAVSVNEIRNVGGFEDDPEGDVILISANKVPLSVATTPPEPTSAQIESINPNNVDEEVEDDDTPTAEI